MPSWQPPWDDVRFDHAAARAAAHELRRTAALLDHTTEARVRAARPAQEGWRGRQRERFDADLARLVAEAGGLVEAMRRTATRIDTAADSARAEQRRRELLRERWREERAAEERRQAAERAAAERTAGRSLARHAR